MTCVSALLEPSRAFFQPRAFAGITGSSGLAARLRIACRPGHVTDGSVTSPKCLATSPTTPVASPSTLVTALAALALHWQIRKLPSDKRIDFFLFFNPQNVSFGSSVTVLRESERGCKKAKEGARNHPLPPIPLPLSTQQGRLVLFTTGLYQLLQFRVSLLGDRPRLPLRL